MPSLPLSVVTWYKVLFSSFPITNSPTSKVAAGIKQGTHIKKTAIAALLTTFFASSNGAHADSMSALIAQKSSQTQLAVPKVKVSTRSTIQHSQAGQRSQAAQRTPISYASQSNPVYTMTQPSSYTPTYSPPNPTTTTYNYQQSTSAPAVNVTYRSPTYHYPENAQQSPSVLPAFLTGNYDNVDSQYLPLLSHAEAQSSLAAREVISTARKMALNERTIIQGGCWDYLDAVFKRAGVTRDTVHKGAYRQGPYAHSDEIEIGDWLYYINHGYNGVEHSGLFVGWVDKSANQALILSYAGESRREPARYRVYDLSNVYQIMRPTI